MSRPPKAPASTSWNPTRRDVLVATAGLAVAGSSRALALDTDSGAMVVRYRAGSPADLAGLGSSLIAGTHPAGRLAAGDPAFVRGAVLELHGLLADGTVPAGETVSFDMGIVFRPEGCGPTEMKAWCYQAAPVPQASPPVRLRVPAADGLELTLEIRGRQTRRYTTRLVTGRRVGEPKLRSGLYFVAPVSTDGSARSASKLPWLALSIDPATEHDA